MTISKSPGCTGLFILILMSLSTGCTSNFKRISQKPVEQVNEHTFTAKEFANELARKLKNYDSLAAKDPNNTARIKETLLREFMVKCLTLDWARAKGIIVTESELDKEINNLRANYPDDLSFRRSLAEENMSFSEWRELLRYILVERNVFKKINENIKTPTEDEIKIYYNSNIDKYKRPERIYLRQIVVEDDIKADAIKNALKTKDFSEIAKKFSITPEGKAGGVVGWIEKGSVDYFDPLFASPPTLSTIKSPFGVHIIKVEKKAAASRATLEEVKEQIKYTLRAQREQAEYIAWLDAQIRSSKVLRDAELVNSITIETRGLND